MKMTIEIQDFSTYIISGRISNIFKILNLKEINFDETRLSLLLKNNLSYDLLQPEQIIHYAKTKTEEMCNKRKYDNEYYFTQLIQNNLNNYIDGLNIDSLPYFDSFLEQKNSILENKLVKEKLMKLKKLKQFNI